MNAYQQHQGKLQTIQSDILSLAATTSEMSTPQQQQQQQQPIQVRIAVKELSLILTTECIEIPPLVKVKLMEVQMTSDNFPDDELHASVALTGSYYNMLKVVWEPLIEDATGQFKVLSDMP